MQTLLIISLSGWALTFVLLQITKENLRRALINLSLATAINDGWIALFKSIFNKVIPDYKDNVLPFKKKED